MIKIKEYHAGYSINDDVVEVFILKTYGHYK